MKFTFKLFALIAVVALASGCATKYTRTSRIYERPRRAGDIHVNKVNPAPIVMSTESATPEVLVDQVTKLTLFAYNESGRCVIEYDLRARKRDRDGDWITNPDGSIHYFTPFEFRTVTPGYCSQYPNMQLGQEIEALSSDGSMAVYYKYTKDDKGYDICELWQPTTVLRIPPGLKSPMLRLPNGGTYALNFTQTPYNGRLPYPGVYFLNADFGLRTTYKGDTADLFMRFHTCRAR